MICVLLKAFNALIGFKIGFSLRIINYTRDFALKPIENAVPGIGLNPESLVPIEI